MTHCSRAAMLALVLLLTGCAHTELRNALNLKLLESTSAEHVQIKAESAFPIGTPYETVLHRLGKSKGDVPPVVMLLTLRPWPFGPWFVGEGRNSVEATSEDERCWPLFWRRSWVNLHFDFDAAGKLKAIKVTHDSTSL